MKQKSVYKLKEAELINPSLADLPKAELKPLAVEGADTSAFKATVVKGKVIDCPTSKYRLIQHEQAFRPIIDGLTVSGVKDYAFTLWADEKRASLSIYIGESEDGVRFGFNAKNSFDRSSAVHYGMKSEKVQEEVQIVEREHVLVWGHRKVCENGLVVKVPLKTTKYLDAITVKRVKELFSTSRSIRHMGDDIFSRIKSVQYLTEGILLLSKPIGMMIRDAQNIHLTQDEAKELLVRYEKRRRLDHYLELYGREEQTLWGLFNAITFFASHKEEGITHKAREKILMRAGDMLTAELLAEQDERQEFIAGDSE